MEAYEGSFVGLNEFDFKNIIPYFKDPVARLRPKYETLMDPLSDKIHHLPEDKRIKYTKFMMNIIAHLSALSRIIEKEIKNLNLPCDDFESDVEINYIEN